MAGKLYEIGFADRSEKDFESEYPSVIFVRFYRLHPQSVASAYLVVFWRHGKSYAITSVVPQGLRFWIFTHGNDCYTKGINKKIFSPLSSASKGILLMHYEEWHCFRIISRSLSDISGDRKVTQDPMGVSLCRYDV